MKCLIPFILLCFLPLFAGDMALICHQLNKFTTSQAVKPPKDKIFGGIPPHLLYLAQFSSLKRQKSVPSTYPKPINQPTSFLHLCLGWNTNSGLGLEFEQFIKKLSIEGGTGFGASGFRFFGGLRYYPYPPFNVSIGTALGYHTGWNVNRLNLEAETGIGESDVVVDIKINSTPVINLTGAFDIPAWNKVKVRTIIGYGFPLKDKLWEQINSNHQFTDDSKFTLNVFSPGGFILGISLGLGIN